jgi:hypothetical protein
MQQTDATSPEIWYRRGISAADMKATMPAGSCRVVDWFRVMETCPGF